MAFHGCSVTEDWTVAMNSADHSLPLGLCLEPASDEHLVMAAQSGDVFAFTELRRRHEMRMRRLLYSITKNWDDADDALQECFLKVFLKLSGFENRSSFATWLTSVAINSGLMVLRKRRWQREVTIDGSDDEGASSNAREIRDCAEDPETYAARREREELLREAILRLPSVYRTVVELRVSQEYSMKQISERLSISLPAAKSRLLRAKKALLTSLEARRHLDSRALTVSSGSGSIRFATRQRLPAVVGTAGATTDEQ
jgi:RNA polymerase sigma-70 factor (ECF subfamily)